MKKLLVVLMCGLLLVGCGQNNVANDSGNNFEESQDNNAAWKETDNFEESYDEYDEEYGEFEEQTAEEDEMMDFTVYSGEVISIWADGLTRVMLDEKQVIPVEQIECVLSDGTTFSVPAASIPEAFSEYDRLLECGELEVDTPERHGDYIQLVRFGVPNADFSGNFFLDNESNEEVTDVATLPLTELYIHFDYKTQITINGFLFDGDDVALADLVEAWGHPLMAHVDCSEGVIESEDYYWRYQNGCVRLTLEDDEIYSIQVNEWDSYAYNATWYADIIPRLEE